jgi:hypothetical protein
MDKDTKQNYDRLVVAEWIDNVRDTEAPEQKGVHIHELILRRLEDPKEYGVFKIVVFSKLYRELLRSGPISSAEMDLIVKMGQMFAVQHGFEKF